MKVVRMSKLVDNVADLVRLRRWALSSLQSAGRNDSAAAIRNFPRVSIESLSFFLRIERCASPLADALDRLGASAGFPAEVLTRIAAISLDDARKVRSAEREAREIGMALHAANQHATVLKGGVTALLRTTPPVTLHDVDLLVTDAAKPYLEEILRARGFSPAPSDEPHHTCWYPPTGRLPVEIHWTTHSDGQPVGLSVWQRAVALDNADGLRRLGWADQVVHLVRHALEQHRDSHVTLRDLWLAGWFIDRLTQHDREFVEAEIERLTDPAKSRAFLAFADSVYGGRVMSDPFEDEAILHFAATVLLEDGPLWRGGPRPAWHNAATVAAGITSLPKLVMFAGRNPVTGIGSFAALQRYAPATGALLTRGARAVHYFGSTVIGVPLLRAVRRRVHERLRLRDQLNGSVVETVTPVDT